jgi:type I restriction enzyme, S subunit
VITRDSESFDDIAKPALVAEKLENVVCGYHLAIVRPNKELKAAFLFRLFQSTNYNYHFSINAKGITRVGLGMGSINDSIFFIPPLAEQIKIVDYLDEKTQKIDLLISTIDENIKILNEFRRTLINDAVTGKIKIA